MEKTGLRPTAMISVVSQPMADREFTVATRRCAESDGKQRCTAIPHRRPLIRRAVSDNLNV